MQIFKKINKIRNKLSFILVLSALIPMMLLGYWASKSVTETRLKNIQELERQFITQLNDRFKKFIDDKIETYRITIADPSIQAISTEQQKYILNGLLLDDPTLKEASFIGLNGMEENNMARDVTEQRNILQNFLDTPDFQTTIQGDDYVSEVFFQNNAPQITIASPVKNYSGEVILVLHTRVDLSGLSDMMEKSVLGETGYSYLTDANGKIMAVSGRLSRDLIGKKSEVFENYSFDSYDVFVGKEKESLSGKDSMSAFKKIPVMNWIVFTEWPKSDAFSVVGKIISNIWILTIVFVALAVVFSIFFARKILGPLKKLSVATKEISKGKFGIRLKIKTGDEFEELGESFNTMAVDLDKFHELQEKKQKNLENAFGQFVGGGMVDNILKGEEMKLGGERKYISILFADIKNFTTISETLEPEILVKYLNKYLTSMTEIIIKHGGVIDKYIGDAILAFWGAPQKQKNHANRACRAAEEMLEKLKEIQKEWESQGLPEIDIRIGITTGGVLVGNVGSKQRLSYTVIGDSVNLAARLEGLNKQYGTRALISQGTHMEVKDRILTREIDKVEVKGKTEGVRVYELAGEIKGIDSKTKKLYTNFEIALKLYRSRKWKETIAEFNKILKDFPNDGPSLTMMERTQEFAKNPPPADWTGVYIAKEK